MRSDYHYPDLHVRLARKSKSWWVGEDHFSIWRKHELPDGYHSFVPYDPVDPDIKVLPYHLFHYARINNTWRKRLPEEPKDPPFGEFKGTHPRDEFNESNTNKS